MALCWACFSRLLLLGGMLSETLLEDGWLALLLVVSHILSAKTGYAVSLFEQLQQCCSRHL
jgi:hypothetical protein